MNSRTKTTVYLFAIVAAAFLVWIGAGPLWRLLLAMHGIHQH